MGKESKVWAAITMVSLLLLLATLARENDISISDVFSSNDASSDDAVDNSTDDSSGDPVENSTSNTTEESDQSYNSSNDPDPISQDCLNHDGLARHDHATLQIFINGEKEMIPTNVGIMTDICNQEGEEMHAVHTHDSSGRLHIESNEDIDIPIGVFFDIWGHHFDETGIFEYRVNSTHELVMTVGGQQINEYDDYLLVNTSDIIEIRYQEK